MSYLKYPDGTKKGHPFYGRSQWKKSRNSYMAQHHYICEMCGAPADVVHHIDPLEGDDYYNNPEKCYGEDNLLCLCHTCHNNIHHSSQAIADGYVVNMVTGEIEVSPPVPKIFSGSESR